VDKHYYYYYTLDICVPLVFKLLENMVVQPSFSPQLLDPPEGKAEARHTLKCGREFIKNETHYPVRDTCSLDRLAG
jgi:hypothetical protein